MQRGERLPKALDDGIRVARKKKSTSNDSNDKPKDGKKSKAEIKADAAAAAAAAQKAEVPTIRPGERMSDFAARVDAALPVSGLINKTAKGGKDPLGLKVGRTKTEKRMHRMYDEWRAQEAKIQERREEERELREEEEEEEDEKFGRGSGGVKWKIDGVAAAEKAAAAGKAGKGKRKKLIGEIGDDDDPWAALKKARDEKKAGLHDVVLAPPTFTKVPREKFKIRGAGVDVGDVPKAAGSLRRREELGEVRRGVVEGYRAMMKANREKMAQSTDAEE